MSYVPGRIQGLKKKKKNSWKKQTNNQKQKQKQLKYDPQPETLKKIENETDRFKHHMVQPKDLINHTFVDWQSIYYVSYRNLCSKLKCRHLFINKEPIMSYE